MNVLVGHSYGGMVATGVADRARDKVRQLIYLDAFVPQDGQSLLDLTRSRGRGCRSFGTGDGWRMPPNPMPPDTAGRHRMADGASRRQPIKCFEPTQAAGGP